MAPHILLWVLMCFTTVIHTLVIEDHRTRPHCRGWLVFRTSSGHNTTTVSESELNTKIVAPVVQLAGCGCFRLFERPRWAGRSQVIARQGVHRVVIRHIRSVARIGCPQLEPVSTSVQADSYAACQGHVSWVILYC